MKRSRQFSPPILTTVAGLAMVALFTGKLVQHSASSAAGAQPNMDCTLIVPADPLSAKGLATPYQLVATNPQNGPCHEANPNQSAFVQSVIYNPTAGKFSVYSPLVIDKGTQPAVLPRMPTLPREAIVGIWFGFNGTNLLLQGVQRTTLVQARCVNGLGPSLFGQFAYCNPHSAEGLTRKRISGKVKKNPGRVRDVQQDIECQNERLDHLGIVAGVCREIGMAQWLDQVAGEQRRVVSVGTATAAMVLNGLGFSNRQLYLVPQFFENKPVEHLLGKGISADMLNDDCLGRTLDWIYEHDPTVLFAGLAQQARQRFGISTKYLHVDTTSFSVSGAYEQQEEGEPTSIAITYGYSRDHRADLKQWMLALVTTHEGDLPRH
jgi:hypothetical protein